MTDDLFKTIATAKVSYTAVAHAERAALNVAGCGWITEDDSHECWSRGKVMTMKCSNAGCLALMLERNVTHLLDQGFVTKIVITAEAV